MSIASLINTHGVTLQIRRKNADTVDAVGGKIETWALGTNVTALFQVRSGAESVAAGAEREAHVATVYFEGAVAVTNKDRIFYDSSFWDITTVRVPDERSSGPLCYTIVECVKLKD